MTSVEHTAERTAKRVASRLTSSSRSLPDPDALILRRVGWRLAALTVGLLCAMLLALGAVVYVTTEHALRLSLEDRLRARSHVFPQPPISQTVRSQGSQNTHPPDNGFPGTPPPNGFRPNDLPRIFVRVNTKQDTNGIFLTVVDRDFKVVGGAGPFGPTLLDPIAAKKVLRTGKEQCCTETTRNGQHYLTYSAALVLGGKIWGVIQTSISEQQYRSSLDAFLQGLLIVSALGLLASAGISGLLARRALHPIRVALRRQRDFVADAAHELRTPLAIMRTSVELGLGADTVDEQQEVLEQVLIQNNHLTRLVDDLSLLARADSGAISLDMAPLDLAHLVAETTEDMSALAEDQGVDMQVDTPEPVMIQGDAGRLRQLLLIVLDNALKHTPPGGTIFLSVYKQGPKALLTIRDTGPGIAEEDLPFLFDRFYQASRVRDRQGAGLGLSIGRWIAEAHGGHIVASNAPSGGAVFTVTLGH